MRYRFLGWMGVLAVVAAAVMPLSVAGQAPATAPKAAAAAKTTKPYTQTKTP